MTYIPSRPQPLSKPVIYGRVYDFSKADGPVLLRPVIEAWKPMSSADFVSVVSDSVEDIDSSGDGAWTIKLAGIGASGSIQEESIDMNGTTPVNSVNEWLAINSVEVIEGSVDPAVGYAKNIGNITITAINDGVIQGYIKAGSGISEQAIYRVPVDRELNVDKIELKAASISASVRPLINFIGYIYTEDKVRVELFNEILDTSVDNELELGSEDSPFVIPENAQLVVTASSEFDASFASAKLYSRLMKA